MSLTSLFPTESEEGGNGQRDRHPPDPNTTMMEQMLAGISALSTQAKHNSDSVENRFVSLSGQIRQNNANVEQRLDELATSSEQEWNSLNHQFEVLANRQSEMDETLAGLVGQRSRIWEGELRNNAAKGPLQSAGLEVAEVATAPTLVAPPSTEKDRNSSAPPGIVGLEPVRRSARLLAKGNPPGRSTSASLPLHVTWTSDSCRLTGGEEVRTEGLPHQLTDLAPREGREPSAASTREGRSQKRHSRLLWSLPGWPRGYTSSSPDPFYDHRLRLLMV